MVVVGHNFRFGKDRAGDFDELTRLGAEHGFETRSHELVGDERGPWSSSRVREALARGDLDDAARMLGRPHLLSGVVVEGDRRGRTHRLPHVQPRRAWRRRCRPSASTPCWSIARSGPPPTPGEPRGPAGARRAAWRTSACGPPSRSGEARPSVEVHLFDVDQDLYGARLRVHLMARLRAEQRFAGLDALKAQIARDAADARQRLSGASPDPAAGGAWR